MLHSPEISIVRHASDFTCTGKAWADYEDELDYDEDELPWPDVSSSDTFEAFKRCTEREATPHPSRAVFRLEGLGFDDDPAGQGDDELDHSITVEVGKTSPGGGSPSDDFHIKQEDEDADLLVLSRITPASSPTETACNDLAEITSTVRARSPTPIRPPATKAVAVAAATRSSRSLLSRISVRFAEPTTKPKKSRRRGRAGGKRKREQAQQEEGRKEEARG